MIKDVIIHEIEGREMVGLLIVRGVIIGSSAEWGGV